MLINERDLNFHKAGHPHLCSSCVAFGYCRYSEIYTWGCSRYRETPPGPVATPITRNRSEVA